MATSKESPSNHEDNGYVAMTEEPQPGLYPNPAYASTTSIQTVVSLVSVRNPEPAKRSYSSKVFEAVCDSNLWFMCKSEHC